MQHTIAILLSGLIAAPLGAQDATKPATPVAARSQNGLLDDPKLFPLGV